MAPDKHVFRISGPQHLTHVNWKNPDHRRSVAATLVQGAYILEHDRQQNRCGSEALATPWWEFFHFQLLRTLIDDADSSIFGAIYELKSPATFAPEAPKYVIAFRGTIIEIESISRDLKLDFRLIKNDLHLSSRFEIAMQAIEGVVSAGDLNVWLAGHSLGSAVAMLTGKKMAKMGVLLESFLFNPPFISAPIERIKDEKLKQLIRVANSFITAGLAVAVKARKGHRSTESFAQMASWVPCLFVNPADHICSEYVGYFEHRKKMEEIGAARIGRLATKNSIVDIFLSALGKESEPVHLLPSANLTINLSPLPDFKKAHGIHQWWRPDCQLKCMLYHYK